MSVEPSDQPGLGSFGSMHFPTSDFTSFDRLVERLGVSPVEPERKVKPWMLICLPDRRKYDGFEILLALLDRLEKDGSHEA